MSKSRPIKEHQGRKAIVAILLTVALAGCADPEPADTTTQQKAPVQVAVVRVAPQTTSLERIYPARARAADEVQIRARVQGALRERHYTEGSVVKADALLFQIDPAPFEARTEQAVADLERAQAQFRQAEREWTRVVAMFKDNAVSARERDQAQSAFELAKAGVATARAQLSDARIQLGYTKVKAPISGHAGMREVSEGNLVQPGDVLTTIRQLDPVHVVFAMPETDALALRESVASSASGGHKLSAELQLPDGTIYEQKGVIDFTATALDAQTGNVQARATFANPKGLLLPGQFVRVSLNGLNVPDSIIVPSQAVGQGPQGPTVYVVDAKNVAQSRSVKLGQSTRDGQIIAEGLREGDRVIVNGMARIRGGDTVAPTAPGTKVAAGDTQ
jgi:membrane fusion protein (multidrug efflux system)